MNSPYVVEAIRACLEDVYLVGGSIRDSLMGLDLETDLDFATPLLPDEVKKRLIDGGFKVIDFSEKYGTISTIISGTKVEITTFRDEEYDGISRNPKVKFIESINVDLARRDFTINAIAHNGEEYVDPFGGQEDIIHSKIRAVGDADKRFAEDPLRILRALRFISTLGFTLETNTFDSLIRSSSLVSNLSGERVSAELEKLLVGDHWIQAISVGVEAKVFENLFNISSVDIYLDEFMENLTSNSERFRTNTVLDRWTIVILSVIGVMRGIYGGSPGGVLNVVFDKLKDRLVWSKQFSESLYYKVRSEADKDSIESWEKELKLLTDKNDNKKYIVEERLLKLRLKNAFNERDFGKVMPLVERIRKIQQINIDIKVDAGLSKKNALSQAAPYIFSILRYSVALKVYSIGYIDTEKQLQKVFHDVQKSKEVFSFAGFNISDAEKAKIIEEGIVLLIRTIPDRVTNISIPRIMELNEQIPRNKERLLEIRRRYSVELYSLRHQPLKEGSQLERADLNLKIASYILEINDGEKDFYYFSHTVDGYKWRALSAKDKSDYWKNFEKMNQAMDAMEDLSNIPDKIRSIKQGHYLDTAQCLIYLLSLEDDLEDKISLTKSIINTYRMSGGLYERNIPRYSLLKDWLTLVNTLSKSSMDSDNNNPEANDNDIEKVSKTILKNLPKLRSYNYIDSDETYILEHFPEINKVRIYMKDLEYYLSSIFNKDVEVHVEDKRLLAATTLFNSKFIDKRLALEILKRVVISEVDSTVSFDPIRLMNSTLSGMDSITNHLPAIENENIKIIQSGENELVEFKESWRYDVIKHEVDSSKVVKKSAIKAIVAFMNTNGGTLYIGVNDQGVVTGLESADFLQYKRKNYGVLQQQDDLRKDIDNSLDTAIGTIHSTLKKLHFDIIDNKTIAVISVEPSKEPVFYEKQLYVRSSASSRLLDTEEFYKFMKERS